MRPLLVLATTVGSGIVLSSFAPTAKADDWSIGIGIGLPGVVLVQPGPDYDPPPVYYRPSYPPGYAPLPPYYDGGYEHHYEPPRSCDCDDEDDDD